MAHRKADLCIIGGGSGGLSVAAGAAQMGANVVLFEGGEMGGDCLITAVFHRKPCWPPPRPRIKPTVTPKWA